VTLPGSRSLIPREGAGSGKVRDLMNAKTVGRNAPCPCGSGLPYKRCCREKDRAEQSARDRARSIAERERQEAARQAQLEVFHEARALDNASNAVVDLVEAGKLDEAEQAARELLERYPQVPDGHERLAMVYEARADWRQAGECYRQVIEFIRARPGEFDPQYEQYLLEKLGEFERLELAAAS
jgi:tetratricopeptide (TPR) repeat protein